jgi:uncharacterized membrane protein (UPF0182 family)
VGSESERCRGVPFAERAPGWTPSETAGNRPAARRPGHPGAGCARLASPGAGTVRRSWFLRPRRRAALVVVALGVPLLLVYVSAQILPGALWFEELGHLDVFRRIAAAKAELWLLVAGAAAPFVALNLSVALSRAGVARTRSVMAVVVAASLVGATSIASPAARHWQTFLLWRHRQPFGVVDPMSEKDVGFFVFSLPFQLLVSRLLLWLIAIAIVLALLVYLERRALTLRPLRATYAAQVHLAALAAVFLVAMAWRFRLERYVLELGQPGLGGSGSFAGARYVDVHVRSPGLAALSILSGLSAVACVAAPRVARRGCPRRAGLSIGVPAAGLLVALVSFASWLPAVVQRFAVDPSPLLREQPFIERSIAATRSGLGSTGSRYSHTSQRAG